MSVLRSSNHPDSATFKTLSERELTSVLDKEKRDKQAEERHAWIDWDKLEWSFTEGLANVRMHGINYIVKRRIGDSMFIQREGELTPCGWFSKDRIRANVASEL